mmetsp:Transcript_39745/g.72213  ORF Transcript_39745/g.72213 Transcript_39745/m.72213 type:complete len:87 (-) Transcript_39745:43-303(-)
MVRFSAVLLLGVAAELCNADRSACWNSGCESKFGGAVDREIVLSPDALFIAAGVKPDGTSMKVFLTGNGTLSPSTVVAAAFAVGCI